MKIGIVTFLSGSASGAYGIPGRNGAEIMVEAINKGLIPAPYNTVGLDGAQIEAIYIDENSKQKVADYQKLSQKEDADIIIGYVSSGSCKALAPIAEKEQQFTVFATCGTPQVFEEVVTDPEYTFRSMSHLTMDNVGAVKYILDTRGNIDTLAGINQNYAFGQDSWHDFSTMIDMFSPDTEVVTEQFPKIFAGQYGSEISALLANKPDVIHSSLWGGDLEALIIQGAARGLFDQSQVVLVSGDTAIETLGPQIPDGTIIGARGRNGDFAPDSEINRWFQQAYAERFGSMPNSASYQMAQSLFAVKAAADKAASSNKDEIRKALKGLEFETPAGTVKMALADGHQAIQDTAYGVYSYDQDLGKGGFTDIVTYNAECVNPPLGVKSSDWIKSGLEGAVCN